MHVFEHSIMRKALAALVFAMAFLLTPRVWVDGQQRGSAEADSIPVDMLERSDECLWCQPAQPADCDVDGDSAEASDEADRLWLNPDEPPPKSETTPCIERPEGATTPSA